MTCIELTPTVRVRGRLTLKAPNRASADVAPERGTVQLVSMFSMVNSPLCT